MLVIFLTILMLAVALEVIDIALPAWSCCCETIDFQKKGPPLVLDDSMANQVVEVGIGQKIVYNGKVLCKKPNLDFYVWKITRFIPFVLIIFGIPLNHAGISIGLMALMIANFTMENITATVTNVRIEGLLNVGILIPILGQAISLLLR